MLMKGLPLRVTRGQGNANSQNANSNDIYDRHYLVFTVLGHFENVNCIYQIVTANRITGDIKSVKQMSFPLKPIFFVLFYKRFIQKSC